MDIQLLKRWDYQNTLPVSWETCKQVKKQQLEPDMEQQTGSKLGRSMTRLYIVTLFILLICRVHHEKCQAGWLISWNQGCWEKYQQPQICKWYHPNGRKWRETKEPLDESERGEWKNWLKTQHSENDYHGIQSHHFMANRWVNNGNSDRLYFGGLQNHCRGCCSHKIKRHLLLGRKVMTNLDSIWKSRDILANKGPSSQSYGFSSSNGYEIWTIKKAECRGIDAFELWCWRRLLESLGLQGDQTSQS